MQPVSARPPDRRTHRRGLSRLRDRPQLRLRANKLPSPNLCEGRDFLFVFKNLSPLGTGATQLSTRDWRALALTRKEFQNPCSHESAANPESPPS